MWKKESIMRINKSELCEKYNQKLYYHIVIDQSLEVTIKEDNYKNDSYNRVFEHFEDAVEYSLKELTLYCKEILNKYEIAMQKKLSELSYIKKLLIKNDFVSLLPYVEKTNKFYAATEFLNNSWDNKTIIESKLSTHPNLKIEMLPNIYDLPEMLNIDDIIYCVYFKICLNNIEVLETEHKVKAVDIYINENEVQETTYKTESMSFQFNNGKFEYIIEDNYLFLNEKESKDFIKRKKQNLLNSLECIA